MIDVKKLLNNDVNDEEFIALIGKFLNEPLPNDKVLLQKNISNIDKIVESVKSKINNCIIHNEGRTKKDGLITNTFSEFEINKDKKYRELLSELENKHRKALDALGQMYEMKHNKRL